MSINNNVVIIITKEGVVHKIFSNKLIALKYYMDNSTNQIRLSLDNRYVNKLITI